MSLKEILIECFWLVFYPIIAVFCALIIGAGLLFLGGKFILIGAYIATSICE